MSYCHPFIGLRPQANYVQQTIAPPYDIVSVSEARDLANNNPYSFLHLAKPEINFAEPPPALNPTLYESAQRHLQQLMSDAVILQEAQPSYYAYRIESAGHCQTGLVAAVDMQAMATGYLRKHELTRPAKEQDRVCLMQACQAQLSPVLLTFREEADAKDLLASLCAEAPLYRAENFDGTLHTLWCLSSAGKRVQQVLDNLSALYIADGHHRSGAAWQLMQQGNAQQKLLAVLFPASELRLLGYHRVIKDLGESTLEGLFSRLAPQFSWVAENQAVLPELPQELGLYCRNQWYRLTWRSALPEALLARLPVSLLHDHIIEPLFNITDPRVDPRIDFIGGEESARVLMDRVATGQADIGFTVPPTQIDDIMQVADNDLIMPPKSTWFEPKLADGMIALR